MPELPEVAVLAKDLARLATGELQGVIFHQRTRASLKIIPRDARAALLSLVGTAPRIESIGKTLVLESDGASVTLHLGMTGQFSLRQPSEAHRPHWFFSLRWSRGECHFTDFRRFARVRVGRPAVGSALGGYSVRQGFQVRPLGDETWISTSLPGALTTPRISWLLRHGAETGIGNYLANEALGRLELSPFAPCRSMNEAARILKACQKLAHDSFKAGGTSFGIGYFRLDGSEGRFAGRLRFYRARGLVGQKFRNRSVYSSFKTATAAGRPQVRAILEAL